MIHRNLILRKSLAKIESTNHRTIKLTDEFKAALTVVKLALTDAMAALANGESSECYLVAVMSGLELYAWELQVGRANGLMAAKGEGTKLPTPTKQKHKRLLATNF